MGTLSAVAGTRIYLDANILIYAFEDWDRFGDRIRRLFGRLDRGELTGISSELSLAELLVKPIRDGNQEAQLRYRELFAPAGLLEVAPVDQSILVQAATIRATSTLKLPDAIHVATALARDCTTFLTNDSRFAALPSLPVLLLSALPG